MKREFSALQDEFDLLVCGGGIYGAWTAYDAALRGLKVALVEQGDWAGATSSASSKLIHGGLRYLETYDFKLVRKALKERRMLLRLAPHRVWPLRFGVPVYADSRNGMLLLEAGLTLYDTLAGFPGEPMRHHHHWHKEFSGHFPFLDEKGLRGGFTYGDAQTDDARLVLELVAGALDAGAACVNHCRVERVLEQEDRACGAVVRDVLDDTQTEIRARQVVYAAGQWMAASEPGRSWCRMSKGVHLVMPALPTDEALLLTAKSDGRVFFLIPWYGRTLLGTTDEDFRGDPENVAVENRDITYLLEAANNYLKNAWNESDIIASFAGVRVMKQSDAAHPSAASRDWELKAADNGVLYSVGGKLTSAREDAAIIVDAVCARLGIAVVCATDGHRLPWTPDDYAGWSAGTMVHAQGLGVDIQSAHWLLRRHGKRASAVLQLIEQDAALAGRIVHDLPFIYADLLVCARDEMVVHLDDLLRRRMPLLILTKLSGGELQQIAKRVATVLGWDETVTAAEAAACSSR